MLAIKKSAQKGGTLEQWNGDGESGCAIERVNDFQTTYAMSTELMIFISKLTECGNLSHRMEVQGGRLSHLKCQGAN